MTVTVTVPAPPAPPATPALPAAEGSVGAASVTPGLAAADVTSPCGPTGDGAADARGVLGEVAR